MSHAPAAPPTESPDGSSWFYVPRPDAASRLRLFCFPFAGGSAAVFRTWPAELPPSVEVCGVQLPGHPRRESPAFTRMEPLLNHLEAAIAPFLDRPFALFGHSLGALIAFELTRRLRRRGLPLPEHLFLGACAAPNAKRSAPSLSTLSTEEFLAAINRLGGIPAEIMNSPDLLDLFMPLTRADLSILDNHRHVEEPALDMPFTILGGDQDRRVSPTLLEGWRLQTRGRFRLEGFSGGHFFLNESRLPLLEVLRRTLKVCVAGDQAPSPTGP